jgi:hypothetical protein
MAAAGAGAGVPMGSKARAAGWVATDGGCSTSNMLGLFEVEAAFADDTRLRLRADAEEAAAMRQAGTTAVQTAAQRLQARVGLWTPCLAVPARHDDDVDVAAAPAARTPRRCSRRRPRIRSLPQPGATDTRKAATLWSWFPPSDDNRIEFPCNQHRRWNRSWRRCTRS